jgi:hypothetical protein
MCTLTEHTKVPKVIIKLHSVLNTVHHHGHCFREKDIIMRDSRRIGDSDKIMGEK